MKTVKWHSWKGILYGDTGRFKFWSAQITGEGDENLSKDAPMKDWKKVVVLRPLGNPETVFAIGFSNKFGSTKISTAPRKIKEGPFGMRMGAEDCQFFITSNTEAVKLELVGYVDVDDKSQANLSLY